MNKALLAQTEKHTALPNADFFLMESLTKFKNVHFPAIIIEYMHKVMNAKDGKYRLA